VADLYHDRFVTCTDDAIVIRWYYLWGSRRIPYTTIRSASRVDMTRLKGRLRIWGTSNPRYWASLDPDRPTKEAALILDTGGAVRAFITPADVQAVEDIIKKRAGLSGIPHAGTSPYV